MAKLLADQESDKKSLLTVQYHSRPCDCRDKKATRSFDRIEIWSRAGDPMAVGVIGEENARYFSIARWGDADLTLEQAKKRLRVEKCLLWSTSTGILSFLVATLVAAARGG